jgi:hypothetical protein
VDFALADGCGGKGWGVSGTAAPSVLLALLG